MYFTFDFGWYSIHFDIVRYEQGVGRFLQTKFIKRDESYLSTILVVFRLLPLVAKYAIYLDF